MLISGTTGIDLTGLPINNSGNTEVEGNLNLSGVGARITGDFSNATPNNRIAFQSSTLNSNTIVTAKPNGTATSGVIRVENNSDSTNASYASMQCSPSAMVVESGINGVGTYLPMAFLAGGAERMRINTAGNVGIGVVPSAWGNGVKSIDFTYGSFFGDSNSMFMSNNTYWNGTNDIYKNTGYATQYRQQNGTHTWRNTLSGTAGNTFNWTNAMTLDSSGNLLLTSGTGGLGYGTGAGGTVTQLTSKSTAVTLNKPSGTIITSNSALSAGATVSFAVNNSLISVIDTIIINCNIGNYRVVAFSHQGQGTFTVSITNITGVLLSETLYIDFAIIKGANS